MEEGMIKGTIKNTETGEISDVEHYLFTSGLKITAIAKIINVNSYEHPGNSKPFSPYQISVNCQALDAVGSIFALNLQFTPDSAGERDKILEEIKEGHIFLLRGEYCITTNSPLTIYEPKYNPLPPDFSEEEIGKTFLMNLMSFKEEVSKYSWGKDFIGA